jgi:hypothetical protein
VRGTNTNSNDHSNINIDIEQREMREVWEKKGKIRHRQWREMSC